MCIQVKSFDWRNLFVFIKSNLCILSWSYTPELFAWKVYWPVLLQRLLISPFHLPFKVFFLLHFRPQNVTYFGTGVSMRDLDSLMKNSMFWDISMIKTKMLIKYISTPNCQERQTEIRKFKGCIFSLKRRVKLWENYYMSESFKERVINALRKKRKKKLQWFLYVNLSKVKFQFTFDTMC